MSILNAAGVMAKYRNESDALKCISASREKTGAMAPQTVSFTDQPKMHMRKKANLREVIEDWKRLERKIMKAKQ